MGADYKSLQEELNNAKYTLITLNDNIRRIVGRRSSREKRSEERNDPNGREVGRPRPKLSDSTKFKRNFNSKNASSVFSRLSAPVRYGDDVDMKPRLHSRIIRELPSRQEIVAAQGADSESRARNRRMFGSLLGTLHKFCQEESRLKQKEEKKAQIEKKVEDKDLQERATLRKEREMLFQDRKKKQMEIQRLELKMSRLKEFEVWEAAVTKQSQNIKTKTKPHIYFRPKVLSKKTEKLLQECQSATEKEIIKKRYALNEELNDIEKSDKLQDDYDADESMDNNDSCILEDKLNTSIMEVDDNDDDDHEPRNNKKDPSNNLDTSAIKEDVDSKENIIKLEEPVGSVLSSVVVVNKLDNNLSTPTQ